MITVTKGSSYVSYKDITDRDSKLIYYPELLSGEILNKIINCISNEKDLLWILAITTGLTVLTRKFYNTNKSPNYSGSITTLFLEDTKLSLSDSPEVLCKAGSIVILGSEFLMHNKFTFPESSIQFFEDNYLPDIYIDHKNRLKYASEVYKTLTQLREQAPWSQCISNKEIILEMIGKGCYGNVYKGYKNSQTFAVKFSKLSKESVSKPYSLDYLSWYEAFFLKDIFKPMITNNICPNLPLLYDTFTCDKYKLTIKNTEEEHPCVITVVELASGDLKQYFNLPSLNGDLVYSALFQIMAALWAIQKYAQILHYDIKKENILFYKIRPGGYFQYKIFGINFYLPNHGYLFILNDFGLARSMSPRYPMYRSEKEDHFRLGSRYAYIKNGKFIPINTINDQFQNITWTTKEKTSKGGEFYMERISKEITPDSNEEKINIDFDNPELFPPFEFYNDTQDVIRMFTGGKRTTQNGSHSVPPGVPQEIIKNLKKYSGPSESLKSGKYSTDPTNTSKFGRFSVNPNQVIAGYFIKDFFTSYTDYYIKPQEKIIGIYEI
jgi:serine/threonine protein kinase